MRDGSCFARGLGLLAVLAILAILVAPETLRAQTPGASGNGQSRYLAEEDRGVAPHTAFLHLATQYTEAVLVGLLTGGLLMNRLVGGSGALIVGTVLGTVVACWLTFRQSEGQSVVREIR